MRDDNDYGQLLEEYRGLVEGLFSLLLGRLYHSQNELIRLKLENERRNRDEQMKMMEEVMKKEI